MMVSSFIATVYLGIMLAGGTILCMLLPPLQVPDEDSHFLHATALARGSVFPSTAADYPAFEADLGYIAFVEQDTVSRVKFRYSVKFDRQAIERAYSMRTQHVYRLRPNNTALYFASAYLPQAVGIRLAALFSDRVITHLIGARLANCFAASVLIYLALLIFPPAATMLIAVSALPMSLFMINSTSQDAVLIALSILFVSLNLRLLCKPSDSIIEMQYGPRWDTIKILAAFTFGVVLLLAFGRAPYLTFVLIPAAIVLLLNWRRYALFAMGSVSVVAVLFLLQFTYAYQFGRLIVHPGADVQAQIRGVFADPFVFLQALWLTIKSRISAETIGVIGWLDTPLPATVYPIAGATLATSALATVFAFTSSKLRAPALARWQSRIILVGVVVASVLSCFLLMGFLTYLVAAPLGSATVTGLQGRYFIELIPIFVCGLSAPLLAEPLDRHFHWMRGRGTSFAVPAISFGLLAMSMGSLAVTAMALIDRYYLQ